MKLSQGLERITVGRIVDGKYVSERRSEQDDDRLAEMLQAQQAPDGTSENQRFLIDRGQYCYENNVDKMKLEIARKAGINTSGKHYVSGLADGRGAADPSAWVSDADDLKAVARDKGLNLSGHTTNVNYGRTEPKPVEIDGPTLSEDIVEEVYQEMVEEDPGVAHRDKREVREEIIDKHAYDPKSEMNNHFS